MRFILALGSSIRPNKEMQRKYREEYRKNRRKLFDSKGSERPAGIGPDVGITRDCVLEKVGKWFDKGQWIKNYGLSLVVFIPEDSSNLYTGLVNAQDRIAKFFEKKNKKDAWIPIEKARLHMTVGPVDVNDIRQNAPRQKPFPDDELKAYVRYLESRISQIGRSFMITFERVFQSPIDGRLSVDGIPVSVEDEKAIVDLRNLLGYKNRIIHIGIGSIKEPIDAQQFKCLHRTIDDINKAGSLGTFSAVEVSLVHHPNDQFAEIDRDKLIVATFPLQERN